MATREQVEAKIAAINDNGNNTASEVRDVLTELLNYAENEPISNKPNVDFFHFWDINPIGHLRSPYLLWYSFKGIKGQSVNFTFRLLIKKPSDTKFEFKLDDEVADTLTLIFEQFESSTMSFVVPVTNVKRLPVEVVKRLPVDEKVPKAPHRLWTIYFQLVENILTMVLSKDPFLSNDQLKAGDEIFTSIQFHCPKFKFDES